MAMKIIPGLPDDIGRECLMRASLFSRDVMGSVCKTWKNIVCSLLFYQDRKRSGLSQQFLLTYSRSHLSHCKIKLYDPIQQSYEALPRSIFCWRKGGDGGIKFTNGNVAKGAPTMQEVPKIEQPKKTQMLKNCLKQRSQKIQV